MRISPSLRRTALALALSLLPVAAQAQSLYPLGAVTLPQLIGRVIGGIMGLLGVLALVMFIYGGFQWMTAQGEQDKIKHAKGTILYAVLGMALASAAYLIVNQVFLTILSPQLTSGS